MLSRLWDALYDKVRAYLLGGTAAAGISGAILWLISTLTGRAPDAWVVGLVTALSGQAVGLLAAYMRRESKPPTALPRA